MLSISFLFCFHLSSERFSELSLALMSHCVCVGCPPHLQGDVLVLAPGQHGGDDTVGLPGAHQGLEQRPAGRHTDRELVADVAACLKHVLLGH